MADLRIFTFSIIYKIIHYSSSFSLACYSLKPEILPTSTRNVSFGNTQSLILTSYFYLLEDKNSPIHERVLELKKPARCAGVDFGECDQSCLRSLSYEKFGISFSLVRCIIYHDLNVFARTIFKKNCIFLYSPDGKLC